MQNVWSANPSETLKNLAKYYRDLLSAISTQAGKHFVDLNGALRYGLTADLGLFVKDIEELISGDSISSNIEKAAAPAVAKIIQRSNDIEESEEHAQQADLFEDNEIILEEQEKQSASAIIVAIYRKQQFDPFNREIIIGYPLVSGKLRNKRICTALFYNKVRMDFDPLKKLITLTKEVEIPSLNFQLIKHVVESDEEVEIIRQNILPDFRRLMVALSLRCGQILNQTEVARDTGISQPTVHRYINLLETACLVERLPAFALNSTKRLIKSPKVIWSDPGLVSFLAGHYDIESLRSSREAGGIFESMVYLHLRTLSEILVPKPRIFYWRTTTGKEVDFVLEWGRKLLAVEVKLSTRPKYSDIETLRLFMKEYPETSAGILVHAGDEVKIMDEKVVAIPWFLLGGYM